LPWGVVLVRLALVRLDSVLMRWRVPFGIEAEG